ncbi:MAG: TetR/AcrR family transcriptional regulator [Devosia sp.]
MTAKGESSALQDSPDRPLRADAQRNLDGLLQAALQVFAKAGVDAPVRSIAEQAGVGVGTLYRHFPNRADLIAAVFRRELDACADAAGSLAAEHTPGEALAQWIDRYIAFLATKRGLATALHSGDPVYAALPAYWAQRLDPAFRALIDAAVANGEMRDDVDPDDLLATVGSLAMSSHDGGTERVQRMVALLLDGMRYRPASSR